MAFGNTVIPSLSTNKTMQLPIPHGVPATDHITEKVLQTCYQRFVHHITEKSQFQIQYHHAKIVPTQI